MGESTEAVVVEATTVVVSAIVGIVRVVTSVAVVELTGGSVSAELVAGMSMSVTTVVVSVTVMLGVVVVSASGPAIGVVSGVLAPDITLSVVGSTLVVVGVTVIIAIVDLTLFFAAPDLAALDSPALVVVVTGVSTFVTNISAASLVVVGVVMTPSVPGESGVTVVLGSLVASVLLVVSELASLTSILVESAVVVGAVVLLVSDGVVLAVERLVGPGGRVPSLVLGSVVTVSSSVAVTVVVLGKPASLSMSSMAVVSMTVVAMSVTVTVVSDTMTISVMRSMAVTVTVVAMVSPGRDSTDHSGKSERLEHCFLKLIISSQILHLLINHQQQIWQLIVNSQSDQRTIL